jgi:hypothetical protein
MCKICQKTEKDIIPELKIYMRTKIWKRRHAQKKESRSHIIVCNKENRHSEQYSEPAEIAAQFWS